MPMLGSVEYIANERGIAEKIKCPLTDDWEQDVDCMENQSVINSAIPERFKKKKNWKEICQKCPFRDY
jgi:hypothetical protein